MIFLSKIYLDQCQQLIQFRTLHFDNINWVVPQLNWLILELICIPTVCYGSTVLGWWDTTGPPSSDDKMFGVLKISCKPQVHVLDILICDTQLCKTA